MVTKRAIPRTALSLCAALFAGFGAAALDAPIDLTARDFFVRPGFDPSWTRAEPSYADPAWTQVPARPGSRPVEVRALALPAPARPFLGGLAAGRCAEYCFVASFDAAPGLIEGEGAAGIYLERVGEGWEAYLNGQLAESQLFRRGDGRLARDRTTKGALIGVDKRWLRPGRNILALRIAGDPASFRTGLSAGGPYLVGSWASLRGAGREELDFALVGSIAFFGILQLLLYALRRASKPYLASALGCLLFAAYLASRGSLASSLFADVALPRGLGLACLFLVFPSFMAYFDLLARGSVSRLSWAYGAACSLGALAGAFFAPNQALVLWLCSLPLPLGYIAIAGLALPLAASRNPVATARESAKARDGADAAKRAAASLWRILPGAALASAAACADAVLFIRGGAPLFARYGFLAFALCGAWALAAERRDAIEEAARMAASVDARIKERTAELETAIAEQSSLNAALRESNLRLQNAMDIQAKDMRMAVQVQQGLFPAKPPAVRGWELAFCYLPAAGVSGDFYDFYLEEGSLEGLVVGDVSGHGIASGLVTILARSVFWRCFRELSSHSLGRVLEEVNAEMTEELSTVENYLTCALLRFRGGQVEYASAGHPELAYRRAGKARANFLVPGNVDAYKGPPLGREGIEAPYNAVKFGLEAGDSLFAYTDGFIEARNEDGEAFGGASLLTSYGRAPQGSAQDMLDYLMDDWRYHVGSAPQADDVTVVLAKRRAAG